MKKLLLTILAAVSVSLGFAQIPNADFESWSVVNGISRPDGWGVIDTPTIVDTIITCKADTPGFSGHTYMKLTTVSAMGGTIVVPGIAVSGGIDFVTRAPKYGFPMSSRPDFFIGAYQYMFFGSDRGQMYAVLTKWNATSSRRDTVATAQSNLPGMEMSWRRFSLPFTYTSTETPDTGLIFLAASGFTPVVNSYLWVDSLGFADSATAINNVSQGSKQFEMFPNPATSTVTFSSLNTFNNDYQLEITSFDGRSMIKDMVKTDNQTINHTVNIANFAPGVYLVRITSGAGTYTEKLIKN